MHILTNSVILIIPNHKSMSDVQIAKIHSARIYFAVYLIRLLKQESASAHAWSLGRSLVPT